MVSDTAAVTKQHRPFRLDDAVYKEPGLVAHVVSATLRRRPFFARDDIAQMMMQVLRTTSAKHDVPLYAFCLMPDHVHLVVGASRKLGIVDFVSEVKAVSARASWAFNVHKTIWQESFRDEVIEQEDDRKAWAAVRYTFRNPVDARMVKTWSDHPYSGSTEFAKHQVDEIFSNPAFFGLLNGVAPFPRRY
jgi:putative transposase